MNTSEKDYKGRDDEVLEALFSKVSSRKRAPQSVENEIREVLHGEWKQQSRNRRLIKRTLGWAIAASVVLALFLSTSLLRQTEQDVQSLVLASVEKMTGNVFVQKAGGQNARLFDSVQVLAGNELSTAQGSRISLTWANGESIRVDENCRVTFISESEIELLSGRVYIDSAGARIKGKAFGIRTPSGLVSHVGTQYITGNAVGSVTVIVREGEVSFGSGEDKTVARQGQKLHISGDGDRTVTPIPVYGEDWQWIEQLAPPFNMDGRTMQLFLEWVGRETGRKIEYDSVETEFLAAQTQLHGKVDFEPLRAMELILQTSDLTAQLKDGVILVSKG